MTPLVVDASVAVKWYLPEPYVIQALRLLEEHWAKRIQFHVPDVFLSECGNVLTRTIRRKQLTPAADVVVRDLLAVPVETHGTPELFLPAWALSVETGQSFYDCIYVALAAGPRAEL